MEILKGKKALILGVANQRSLGWGIAKALKAQGAQVALTYVNDAIKKRVEPLAEELQADFTAEMDVTNDEHYEKLTQKVKEEWGTFDILVHSLAFAKSEDLKGRFSATPRQNFLLACDISAFSLVGLSHALKGLMNPNGSIITMSYYGAQKVVSNYNVMGVAKATLEASVRYLANDLGEEKGIKVNAISAGPIKTLAASGVSGFSSILKTVENRAPLRKNVTIDDVGNTALYLASNLSGGVTGQTIFVDSGYSILGL